MFPVAIAAWESFSENRQAFCLKAHKFETQVKTYKRRLIGLESVYDKFKLSIFCSYTDRRYSRSLIYEILSKLNTY